MVRQEWQACKYLSRFGRTACRLERSWRSLLWEGVEPSSIPPSSAAISEFWAFPLNCLFAASASAPAVEHDGAVNASTRHEKEVSRGRWFSALPGWSAVNLCMNVGCDIISVQFHGSDDSEFMRKCICCADCCPWWVLSSCKSKDSNVQADWSSSAHTHPQVSTLN